MGRTYTLHSFSHGYHVSIVRICSNVIYACMLQIACDHRRSSRDPHPSCELCREASQLLLCTPQDTCECCADLRLDSWNILLRARRKRMWRKQRREEATGTMTDTNVNTADGPGLTIGYPTHGLGPSFPRTGGHGHTGYRSGVSN